MSDEITKKIRRPTPEDVRANHKLIKDSCYGPGELGYKRGRTDKNELTIYLEWRTGDIPADTGGWKMHVTAKPEHALIVARIVLPELWVLDIPHKVVVNKELYEKQLIGSQKGKFVTIYNRDVKEGELALKKLDAELLTFVEYGALKPGPRPVWRDSAEKQLEWPIGDSGFISTSWHQDYRK
jgi:hypothetical protein